MGIQYHLTPIELIELLEPVFGDSTISGFTEEEVIKAEERLQIKIPAVYRDYLLKCGKCSLNYVQNYLYTPEQLELTYDRDRAYRDEDYDPDDPDWAVDHWVIGDKRETVINPYGVVFQHPEEEWGQFVKNYLMIWNENQGVWEAGICVDDFGKEDIPVYIPTDYYQYHWKMGAPSIQSFLCWMIFYSIDYQETLLLSEPSEIQNYFETNQIELEKLTPNPPIFSDEYLSTFFLPDKKVIGFYIYNDPDSSDHLYIFNLSD